MTQKDGRIIRFLEKPSWSEVFSDTVNTGIYVLEPEILQFFKQGQVFDFSKDLFPLMLQKQLPLFGYVADGYWSDIGNLQQYRQTQFDMLDGNVMVELKGNQTVPGIWVGEGVNLHPDALIQAPAFIGEGSLVEANAELKPYTVLGRYTRVASDTIIERSVIWNRNFIGKTAYLTGTLLCDGVQIGIGAQIHEGSVVGEKSMIGDLAVIKPRVKIWPEKTIAERTIQQQSLIYECFSESRLFGENGIKGIPNVDLTPEKVSKISAAFASCFKRFTTITVGSDDHPYSRILCQTVISSLMASGIHVRDVGEALPPVVLYDARRSESSGAIYIKKPGGQEEKNIILQFYDESGLPIDQGWARKVENAYMQEDFSRPDIYEAGTYIPVGNAHTVYLDDVLGQFSIQTIRARGYRIDFHCGNTQAWPMLKLLFMRLGCDVHFWSNSEPNVPIFSGISEADIIVHLDENVESLRLYTPAGTWTTKEEMLILQMLLAMKEEVKVAVPVEAPSVIYPILEQNEIPFKRSKSSIRSLLEVGMNQPFQVFADGIYLLVSLLDYMAEQDWSIHQVMDWIPTFYMVSERVECPIEAKGKVMRRLMEEIKEQPVELLDGIKVLTNDGWALILPDSEKALFKVIAQGNTPDRADELTQMYKDKILAYQQM
jgi:mannose-1-phosphate guanylyltransferase/phosphomannomutase